MLAIRHSIAKLLHRGSFKFGRHGLEDHHAGVPRVPDIRRRGVRNECGPVIAIEIATVGELHVHGADDGKTHAINAHGFAHGRRPAEKLFLQASSEENDPAAFGDIVRGNPAAFRWDFVAHLTILGINAENGAVREAFVVRNTAKFNRFQSYALHERRLRLYPIGIFLLEPHRFARAFAARLLTRSAGPADHRSFPKDLKGIQQHAAESRTIAQQQSYSHDAPGDAGHRKQTAHAVASQRDPRLLEYFDQH